jgi:hypothetical protein
MASASAQPASPANTVLLVFMLVSGNRCLVVVIGNS